MSPPSLGVLSIRQNSGLHKALKKPIKDDLCRQNIMQYDNLGRNRAILNMNVTGEKMSKKRRSPNHIFKQ